MIPRMVRRYSRLKFSLLLFFYVFWGASMAEAYGFGQSSPRWTLKVYHYETQATKYYRLPERPVAIPGAPEGVSCFVTGESREAGGLSRWLVCRSIEGISVTSKTYVRCSEGRDDSRVLDFQTSQYEPEACESSWDARSGAEFCLPEVVDHGLKMELRCRM